MPPSPCQCENVVCIFNVFLVMNPYLITAAIENLTPWKYIHGGDDLAAAMNYEGGDTSGYTACIWEAVWQDSADAISRPDQRVWTQTRAEELLQDARDYFDEVIVNVSEQDRRDSAFARWRSNFLHAMKNLQWKINGEHYDVGPFAPDEEIGPRA